MPAAIELGVFSVIELLLFMRIAMKLHNLVSLGVILRRLQYLSINDCGVVMHRSVLSIFSNSFSITFIMEQAFLNPRVALYLSR